LPVAEDPFDPASLLERLALADVDFVLIGAVAGGAHGSSYGTPDIDIAFADHPENLDRFAAALTGLGTDPAAEVTAFACTTPFGRLKCFAAPIGAPSYSALKSGALPIELRGRSVLVASLDHLIAMKEAGTRTRDELLATEYRTISDELRAPRES
jgi:hypothetical protein